MLKRFLILLVLLSAAVGSSHAQGEAGDWLVVAAGGQLWAITDANNPTLSPITFCSGQESLVSPLVMAPNGDHLAYVSSANQEISDPAPTVIWLCNGIDRRAYQIGTQPNNGAATGQASSIYRVYARPDWSPDSMSLAWTGLTVTPTGNALALFQHDVASGQTTTILDAVPVLSSPSQPLRVAWGQPGIIIHNGDDNEFLMHTKDQDALLHFAIPRDAGKDFVEDFFWVGERLAVIFNNGAIELFDPVSITWEPVTGLQGYAPEAPENAMRLNLASAAIWETLMPTGETISLPYNRLPSDNAIAVAPGGNTVAYITDRLYLWQDGQIFPIDVPDADYTIASLVWSPMIWTVR